MISVSDEIFHKTIFAFALLCKLFATDNQLKRVFVWHQLQVGILANFLQQ